MKFSLMSFLALEKKRGKDQETIKRNNQRSNPQNKKIILKDCC